MNDLVSVIIPYYKKLTFIRGTLRSVIKQSYKNLEIIVIYDDSDEKELKTLKTICKVDKRIKILINRKNIGVGKSRNRAMKIAKGKFIAFIDSDDKWHKKKIELQVKYMKKNNLLISHTDYKIIKLNMKNKKRIARDFYKVSDLIKSCDIGLSTSIIRSDIINKNKFPSLKTKEDFVFWLRYLDLGYKIKAFNKCLTFWYQTEGSLSSNLFQKIFDGYRVYRNYMNFGIIKSWIHLFLLSKNYLIKDL